ncbi:hypothetical protein [Sinomicrobium sp.]
MKTLNENQQTNYSTATYKLLSLLVAVLFSVLIFSCSDDGDQAGSPVLEDMAQIEAVLLTEGNSATPKVVWNGDQGTFALTSPPVQGLSIDENTGVLSWGKDLPMGEHAVEITATNKEGSSSVSTVINNPFQGKFSGLWDGSDDGELESSPLEIEMEFSPDGSIGGSIMDRFGEYNISGNWELDDSELYAEFTFDSEGSGTVELSWSEELNFGDDGVTIGITTFYIGYDLPEGGEYGDIQLCMGDCDL